MNHTLFRAHIRRAATTATLCGVALVLSACAGGARAPLGSPIVDLKGVNRAEYQTDLAECETYADEVSASRRAVAGAVGGAVVGGLIGAAVGNSDVAKRSAGGGAVWGGAKGGIHGLHEKNRVVKQCLIGRGYRVLN